MEKVHGKCLVSSYLFWNHDSKLGRTEHDHIMIRTTHKPTLSSKGYLGKTKQLVLIPPLQVKQSLLKDMSRQRKQVPAYLAVTREIWSKISMVMTACFL